MPRLKRTISSLKKRCRVCSRSYSGCLNGKISNLGSKSTLMKVLIITYYWPPAGGPGVQRWLKFVKYLPDYGVEPLVYIPENPTYPLQDNGLLAEVNPSVEIIKNKIIEPYA